MDYAFSSNDFSKAEGEQAKAIFKIAAHRKFAETYVESDIVAASVKYQVLSKHTALIGVVKQKCKATGEMLEHDQTFDKVNRVKKEEPKPVPLPVNIPPPYQAPALAAHQP